MDRASQTGFIGPTVKNELQSSADFRACYKVVAKCIKQKESGVYDVEGNSLKSKYRVAGAGSSVRVIVIGGGGGGGGITGDVQGNETDYHQPLTVIPRKRNVFDVTKD